MDIFFAAVFFVFGAVLASFLTVVTERLFTGTSWIHGRSRCNSCNRILSSIDVVPLVSWIVFLGRCRTCRSKIPATYVVGELLLGSVFAGAYLMLGFSVGFTLFLICVALLFLIVLYDIRHTIILLPALGFLLFFSFCFAYSVAPSLAAFGITLIQASLAGFFLYALHVFSKGKAMGLGDTPLVVALACIAQNYALSGLLFSFWIGAGIGIVLLVFGRGRTTMKSEVPFAPFLALGFLLAFFLQWNPFLSFLL